MTVNIHLPDRCQNLRCTQTPAATSFVLVMFPLHPARYVRPEVALYLCVLCARKVDDRPSP